MKIIFSPCLYCKDNDLYDLFMLNNTLSFVVEYLNCSLDNYTEAFYSDERMFLPPVMQNINEYMQYLFITTNLYKLKVCGEDITIHNHNIPYEIDEDSFIIVNNDELQVIVDYMQQLSIDDKLKDVLLFVGEQNECFNKDTLNILISGVLCELPIVKNPLKDKSGNFNSYIKSNSGKDGIFAYRNICLDLVEEMNKNLKSDGNGSLYKQYGKIIALRNRYNFYYPKKPYDKNTHYFISYDKKYIISIDLKHGHFEIFDNTNRQLWMAKYSFSGEVISQPTDPNILKNLRKTHKVEE